MVRIRTIVVLLALVAMAVSASAQRGGMMMGGGGNSVGQLLGRADVQKDLGLSTETVDKIRALNEQMRNDRQAIMQGAQGGGDMEAIREEMAQLQKDYDKKFDALLTDAQRLRVKEIRIQMMGARAITDADVQKQLGMTAEQVKAVRAVMDENRATMEARMRERMQGGGGGGQDRQAMMDEMRKMNEELDKKLNAIPTAEQKAKLKELGGKPFKREDPPAGQGRRGGGN